MHAYFSLERHHTVDSFQTGVRQVCGNYIVRSAATGDGLNPGEFPFVARTGLLRQPGTEIAYVRLGGLEVERTSAQIRSDDVNHFVFTMQLSGVADMAQGRGTAHLRPNDIFVSDATRPSRFCFAGGEVEQVSLHIPRNEALGRFDKLLGQPSFVRGDSGFAVALRVLLQRLIWQMAQTGVAPATGPATILATGPATENDERRADDHASWLGHETSEKFQDAFFSVLASALLDAKSFGSNAPREQHDRLYNEALCIIHQKANDPNFGPGQLCVALGVSPRQLQRSFLRFGESARDQLLSFRLERARRRIQIDPARTVTEIAYASGFNDLSFFYRAYRKQFGVAPGERRLSAISQTLT